MAQSNEAARKRRARLVADGLCGWCKSGRNLFRWLCDDCARRHREKQRHAKKLKELARVDLRQRLLAYIKEKRGKVSA